MDAGMTQYDSLDARELTKEAIFDKVMRGLHLTVEEKEFVVNGYRRVEHPRMLEAIHPVAVDW